KHPTTDSKHHAEGQEGEIPRKLIGTRPDVVDTEYMMVDHALDQVEQPPPDRKGSDKQSRGPYANSFLARPPEQHEPHCRHHPGERVEQAVEQRVQSKILQGVRRVRLRTPRV